jgi:hypothetical protein
MRLRGSRVLISAPADTAASYAMIDVDAYYFHCIRSASGVSCDEQDGDG